MAMTLKEYQERVPETVMPKVRKLGWLYPLLGIGGESGEILEKFKKIIRDKLADKIMAGTLTYIEDFLDAEIAISTEDKKAISKELGDQMFYVAWMCTMLGLDLETVAQENQDKLQDRKKRGVLGGSGDER